MSFLSPEGLRERVRELHQRQKWCLKMESAPRLHAMVDLARSEEGIPILPENFDQNPWLFNCANGTLDLRNGKLREHCPEDLIRQLSPTPYRGDASCPVWEQTLDAIFAANVPLIYYFQRLVGYSLTGDVREQVLPIFWGSGSNGKSLLVGTLMDVLGPDYAFKAPRDLFMAKKSDQHPTLLASLFGKRFVACLETKEGGRLDEALVKELTGGDVVTARGMREDYWSFKPLHKALLITNHKPEIRGSDHAIWRRCQLVPFTVRFWDPDKGEEGPPELKVDKTLAERLNAEHEGILAWCVKGCRAWQEEGLGTPPAVREATATYRAEEDVLGRFIGECCLTGDNLRCKAGKLYARFHQWQEETGEKDRLSQKRFGNAMGERGYTTIHSNGTWYLKIALRDS